MYRPFLCDEVKKNNSLIIYKVMPASLFLLVYNLINQILKQALKKNQ